MNSTAHQPRHYALALAVAFLLFGAIERAEAEEAFGQVASLGGNVTATGPDGERTLACGDSVFPGDRLSTADGSHVGVFTGDALAYLAESSALQVTDDGTMGLEAGKFRVLDTQDGNIDHKISVLSAVATSDGNDTEGYIFKEKTGNYAMLCEFDKPIGVARGDEMQLAEPGKCVIAKNGEPLYPADGHEERLGPVDAGPCGGSPPGGDLASLDVLPPVGAGADALALGEPLGPTIDPCDNPGSGCGGFAAIAPVTPGGPGVIQPPPVGVTPPGGGGAGD